MRRKRLILRCQCLEWRKNLPEINFFMKKIALFFISFLSIAICKAQLPLTDMDASAYVGKYKIETNNIVAEGEIRFENSALIFFTEGFPEVKLNQAPEIDKFRADKFEVILQFMRSEFKEVIAAKIWFQGQEFLAKKL